jgi:3-oxoacyl-[acyl-carrier-protein] synthase II
VDVAVTGGAEAILNRFGLAAFGAMQALAGSASNAVSDRPPSELSRPFDAERCGFVMGEGAGVLVLERLADAQRRGATIHGVIRGVGCSTDAYDIVSPCPGGHQSLIAMQLSLADARLTTADLDLIKAHATGTVAGDAAEARAIDGLVGAVHAAERPWVIAPKAVLGHLISASGPVELLLTLDAMNRGELPRQANCPKPDPLLTCKLPQTPTAIGPTRSGGPATALMNSFGFGGRNVSLVVEGVVSPQR